MAAVPVPSLLPASVAAAVARFRTALEARFGGRLRELTLFGSHARGEAHEESDVDLLVVVDNLTEAERVQVFDLAYCADSVGEDWTGLAPLAYSSAQVQDLRSRERLLMRDIAGMGLACDGR